MASDLLKTIRRFRSAIRDLDADQTMRIAAEYRVLNKRLQEELGRISDKIERAVAEGKVPGVGPETSSTFSRAWLMQRDRLQALASQAEVEGSRLLRNLQPGIRDDIARAAGLGIDLGHGELGALGVDFSRLNRGAIESFIGATRTGSPLSELFGRLSPTMGQSIRDAISQGMALGWNPRQMARAMERGVGLSAYRANLIARTETLRAFRNGTFETYRENDDIVKAWIWLSARDRRTCAACWAMDGQKFEFGKGVLSMGSDLHDHPNGRCTAVPDVEGVQAALGDKNARFAELSERDQRGILGKTRHERWKNGQPLDDFAKIHSNPRWGESPRIRRVRDLPDLPVRVPEWRPTMNRVEAEAWAKGSAYEADLFHVTSAENAARIRAEGFEVRRGGFGRVWGNGAYQGLDDVTAEFYERIRANQTRLTVKARLGRVFEYDIDPMLDPKMNYARLLGSLPAEVRTRAGYWRGWAQGESDRLWSEADRLGLDWLAKERYVSDRMAELGIGGDSYTMDGITKALDEAGYDALLITQRTGRFQEWAGGNQVIIFDPRGRLVVVE